MKNGAKNSLRNDFAVRFYFVYQTLFSLSLSFWAIFIYIFFLFGAIIEIQTNRQQMCALVSLVEDLIGDISRSFVDLDIL